MIICSCGAVSHTAICLAVEKDGVRTVKQLQEKLNATNNCKKCAVAVHVVLKLALAVKAANKKAGIKSPIQLELRVMLDAIAAAEKSKRYNPSRALGVRKVKIEICTEATCTCGKICR